MTSGRPNADHRERVPTSAVARERVSRDATHLPRRRRERIHTCAERQSRSLVSFFPLYTNHLTQPEKKTFL
jgi:hypothetical protein